MEREMEQQGRDRERERGRETGGREMEGLKKWALQCFINLNKGSQRAMKLPGSRSSLLPGWHVAGDVLAGPSPLVMLAARCTPWEVH